MSLDIADQGKAGMMLEKADQLGPPGRITFSAHKPLKIAPCCPLHQQSACLTSRLLR
jgi:hypothetical protein